MTADELKNIHDFLRYGRVFDSVLRKNPNLFANKLTSIDYRSFWFEYNTDDIQLIGEPIIDEIQNNNGDFFHVYISDFRFTGNLCYSNQSYHEIKLPIILTATLRIFKNPDYEINLFNNHVEVWDLNQKITNLTHFYANKKLSGLDLIPYDYGLYTKTWPKIDKSSTGSIKQSHVTSYYYFKELIECYERIKHLLSIVLLNYDYSNKYTDQKVDLPDHYESQYMFEISNNFKIYDRYYLMYSELTIESFYKFWERLGFYLFQFLKPSSNKVNDKNLSLFKLIEELNKEYSSNALLQNIHFDWFVNFVIPDNSDFRKLSNYRHPFIHYKVDNASGKGVGSLIASVLNNWHDNMFDLNKMSSLESENRKINCFLTEQFNLCKIGYDHMIELIKLLPNRP